MIARGTILKGIFQEIRSMAIDLVHGFEIVTRNIVGCNLDVVAKLVVHIMYGKKVAAAELVRDATEKGRSHKS
jgi:hypothetical protein